MTKNFYILKGSVQVNKYFFFLDVYFKKGFFTVKNVSLALTGLHDPFNFRELKCEKEDLNYLLPLNETVYYGKIGENYFFDRLRFFFSTKDDKIFNFILCEKSIGGDDFFPFIS